VWQYLLNATWQLVECAVYVPSCKLKYIIFTVYPLPRGSFNGFKTKDQRKSVYNHRYVAIYGCKGPISQLMQEYNSSTAPPSATICLVHNLAGVVSRDVRHLLCCTWMMYLLCCTWSRRPCAWLRFGRTCSRSRRARTGSCLPVEEKNFLSSLVGAFIAVAAPFFSAVYIYIFIFIFIYLVTAHVNYSHELVQFGQLGIIPRTKCHLSDLLNVPKSIVYHDWANLLVFIEWTFYTCHLEKWQPYHWEYQGHQLIVSQYIHHLIGGFDPIKIEVK
jgi:hypothetical protein